MNIASAVGFDIENSTMKTKQEFTAPAKTTQNLYVKPIRVREHFCIRPRYPIETKVMPIDRYDKMASYSAIKWKYFCANIGGVSKVCIVSAEIGHKLCGLANSHKFCVFFADAVYFFPKQQIDITSRRHKLSATNMFCKNECFSGVANKKREIKNYNNNNNMFI